MSEEETGISSNATKALAEGNELKIGEKVFHLKYTLWSFCKIDELTGKNPLDGANWTDVHPKDVLVLFWAGIQHESELTIEELGNLISLSDIPKLAPIIQKAFGQASLPEEEKKTSP